MPGAVLTVMAGLTLLMPVSYRAGTDDAHPHTVFQIWIDAVTGRSHHHHDGENQPGHATYGDQLHGLVDHTTTNAIAHAQALPHLHAPNGDAVILGDAPVTQQPDHAEPVTSAMPIQHAGVLETLGTLIAMLLAGLACRPSWAADRRLTGIVCLPDPPPPRVAPC